MSCGGVAAGELLCGGVGEAVVLSKEHDGTIFRGGQPFRRASDGLIDGCEEGGGRNWMGSCGGQEGTGRRRDFRAFSYFSVDRELDLVRELFLALGRRAHNNKHAVLLQYRIGRWCARWLGRGRSHFK